MTDKPPPRPVLGLHERIDNHPIQIVIEKVPGIGHCPACDLMIELKIATEDFFEAARCPYCHTPIRLAIPTTTK